VFCDSRSGYNKGVKMPLDKALSWIRNNLDDRNFRLFAGGTVAIVCNETNETIYEKSI